MYAYLIYIDVIRLTFDTLYGVVQRRYCGYIEFVLRAKRLLR